MLEPLQAGPVIIEDDCFIGARSEVAEGVVVEQGAVISMGVFIGASTKIVDRATGEVIYGRVPAYSVVVPGTLPGKDGGPGLACAVIVKRVDAKTRSKTGINELLGTDRLRTSPAGHKQPLIGFDRMFRDARSRRSAGYSGAHGNDDRIDERPGLGDPAHPLGASGAAPSSSSRSRSTRSRRSPWC